MMRRSTGAQRRALAGVLAAVLVATGLITSSSTASGAPAVTFTVGSDVVAPGGFFVADDGALVDVAVDGSGGYGDAGVLNAVTCGNADAAGNPVSEPICFGPDDIGVVTFIIDGSRVSGLAAALDPAGDYAFTYVLNTIGFDAGTGSCVAAGTIPCEIRVYGARGNNDPTRVFSFEAAWCLPTMADADGNGIPDPCDGDRPPPPLPPPPSAPVLTAGRSCAVDPPYVASSFADVPAVAWYRAGVDFAAESGVTLGVAAGLFGPDLVVDRLTIARMLHRMSCSPSPSASAPTFRDSSDPAVRWLAQVGVTAGVAEGLFGAAEPATRGQIAVLVHRILGSPAPAGPSPFTDVAESAYFAAAITWLHEAGIVNGVTATTYEPDVLVTRAQLVELLRRVNESLA